MTQAFDEAISHPDTVGCFENLIDTEHSFATRNTEGRPEKVEVLGYSHIVVRAKSIGHVSDESLDAPRVLNAIRAGNASRTARGSQKTDEDSDCRRFPRAVGTDKTKNLTSVDMDGQSIERSKVAKTLCQLAGLNNRTLRHNVTPAETSAIELLSFREDFMAPIERG